MNYNKIAKYLKPFFHSGLRRKIRQKHQNYIFRKAIEKFKQHHKTIEKHPEILQDLIYGWGNMGWSAMNDYLMEVLQRAKKTQGNILECGSGLSTILIGIMINNSNTKLTSLEHQKEWADKVNKILTQHDIINVEIKVCPIVSYEKFDWYDVKQLSFSEKIALVVCDGPPADIRGARVGMMPIMKDHFTKGSFILMDDYIRTSEKDVVMQWKQIYDFSIEEKGKKDLYAVLTMN